MFKSITFITGNANKAKELANSLDFPITHQKLDLIEIQSVNSKEIIEHKVKEAYKQISKPVFVEDTSLTFLALGKLPGPLIKWFLKELGNDGLCKLLNGFPNRRALASVSFGLYDGKKIHIFEGEMEGSIAKSPRGEKGFGWDPIFIPKGYKKTWGEMDTEEKMKTSMRRIALKKLENYLKNL